uniref:Treslin_N domain-containing protein n=1 Tax=Caenorhabditis tropicalis TaxID=1561998 RepID=A0A1I7TEU9_9PELO
MRDHAKQDHPAPPEPKTFEDAAFEMISTVSPIKLPRENIPFDSVRQIVLTEILRSKQKTRPSTNGRRNMDDLLLDEAATSSSSSSHLGESSSSILERGTMTDDGETGTPRPIAARLYGDNTRSSTTSTSSAAGPSGSSDNTETTKKKPLNYREKRLAEIRAARMKKYRENAEIVEFKCEESGLLEAFEKFYGEILTEEACPANVYYRIVESLDFYFRAKTWESNCPKLLCEFLCENILKSCQELNELHEKSSSSDEWKSREIQIQVLLTLHVFVVTDERKWLDEAINKMRMIFIAVGAAKLRTFVEEPVTDIFLDLIGDSLATIYEELCINLPADLLQYNNGMFRMTESDDTFPVKRRNGIANRLEQVLLENSDNFGVGASERPSRATALSEAPKRRSLKRKNEEIPKELLSPNRPTRATVGRSDYKQFFVEDTPDEKYKKRIIKKEVEEDEDEEEPEDADEEEEEEEEEVVVTVVSRRKKKLTIKEEIEEEVKQTPVAKLRASAASHNGKRCSKRLSDLVKLSEERSQVPKKARESLSKIVEKAKTPARSFTRPTRKSVLFGETPTSSPATISSGKKSRSSLIARFTQLEEKNSPEETELSVDTSGGHDLPTTSSESTTPVIRERSSRNKRPSARFRDDPSEHKNTVKQEPEDSEFDEIEMKSPRSTKSSASSAPATPATKWTDRKLRRQLGLTREDLNRYRDAMLSTGARNTNKNESINWENAQVNRAGRVKGAGAGEDGAPIFGIARRNVRTMICHVLLNETNPDTSFNWNKVKFDELGDKPRTRQLESLFKNPEAYMESLKQQYIKSKTSPLKRSRSAAGAISSEQSTSSLDFPALKRRKICSNKLSPKKKSEEIASASISASSSAPTLQNDDFDEFGFETEADV